MNPCSELANPTTHSPRLTCQSPSPLLPRARRTGGDTCTIEKREIFAAVSCSGAATCTCLRCRRRGRTGARASVVSSPARSRALGSSPAATCPEFVLCSLLRLPLDRAWSSWWIRSESREVSAVAPKAGRFLGVCGVSFSLFVQLRSRIPAFPGFCWDDNLTCGC